MPTYPNTPRPSAVSAPELIDSMLSFSVGQGYSTRRSRWSRQRRRWTLEYLGLSTANLRILRNFLSYTRLGVLDFDWSHPTALEVATFQPTTPVTVLLNHGLVSGQMVGVSNTPNPGINGGFYTITVTSESSFTLNGTTAAGIAGTGNVVVYVPHMMVVMQDGVWPAPATLIGPDQIGVPSAGTRSGYFNATVTLEELF